MIGPRFVLRMAWRESRAGRRRLWLLTGAVTAGVAALVAINSFTQNLRVSVAEQARALLGADLSFRSGRAFPPRVEALLDSLIAPDSGAGRLARSGRRALQVSFVAMAYVPRTTGVRLVQARAVAGGYPFYGEIVTQPAGRWRALERQNGVLVDPVLLTALHAELGDTLALGNGRFPILGTVLNVPGDIGVFSAFGARVFLPARSLPATGLLQFGSRADYEAFVQLPPGRDAAGIAKQYRSALRELRIGIRTVEEDREDLSEALSRLGNYLGLVALIALLLGGLGVASAVNVFIKRKLDTIAVLRCLGATSREVFAVYLLQALAMGGIGSAIGALAGVALQQLLPLLFTGLLPVDVRVVPSPGSILLGTGLGLWVAGMFAALPLLGIRRVSPLLVLRRDVDPAAGRDRLARLALLPLALSVVALAVIQVGSVRDGIAFAVAIGVALFGLWLAARALIGGVRRWFPSRWPYLWRQGLANLYRPANQTVTVVLALGFGAFVLTTLFLAQNNLLREFRPGGLHTRPNLMLYDIQPAQQAGVAALIRENGLGSTPAVPIVTMRIKAIRGVPVSKLLPPSDSTTDSAAAPRQRERRPRPRGAPSPWAIRREYRSTYRDTLSDTEKVVAGKWWGREPAGDSPALVSLEEELAGELGVKLGDEIVWDVQGTDVPTRVGGLRAVEWRRFEPNFFVVFQPGVLERMPQMLVMLARADSVARRGTVQRQIAERFPNVTILDLSQIQQALEGILDRGALIVRFLAFFSLVTGAIVLVGSVSASRLQRIREAVLLKTLGATRRQVLHILVAEYTALGVLAAFASVALASGAGWALTKWVFETEFYLPALQLLSLTVLLIGLTLGVGLWNSAEILKRAPLAVLREE
ncbi:MAG TPA: FtsX-like permease family protein [Gemmatimonadales bacterium]|nr:FtsX-like permease family protein [Gemmatimonadales bacterium]